jgi:hypothetical protein
VPDQHRCVRIGGLQLGAHRSGGGFDQLDEVLPGKVAALAQDQRQLAVPAGAGRELVISGKREARSIVACNLANDAIIAVIDQDIGHRLA